MRFINRGDGKARKVLTELKRLALNLTVKTGPFEPVFCVEVYENGREHGFAVTDHRVKVAFSEHRNSDNIVVYVGNSKEFEFNTNIPSEKVWEDSKHFRHNEYQEAAWYIYNVLTGKAR